MKKLLLLVGLVVFLAPTEVFSIHKKGVTKKDLTKDEVLKDKLDLNICDEDWFYKMPNSRGRNSLGGDIDFKLLEKMCKLEVVTTYRDVCEENYDNSQYKIYGRIDNGPCSRFGSHLEILGFGCKSVLNEDLRWSDCWVIKEQFRIKAKRITKYQQAAIFVGCGLERKDVDDCLNRGWPPPQANTGDAWDAESRRLEQQAQAQNTDGYYKEQSNGNYVWVDTRSGAEKFTDKFCFNCNATQVYMINRATKRYFQNAPLSGFDKFILRGGNTNKVIKFNK